MSREEGGAGASDEKGLLDAIWEHPHDETRDRGATALARSRYSNNVTVRRLALNRFGTGAVAALAERFGIERVRV